MPSLRNFGLAVLVITLAAWGGAFSSPSYAAGWGGKAQKKAMMGTQLIMLGTGGGPILRKDRARTSTLLIVDGTTYMIDCGIGALQRMVEAGIRPASVKTIFFTHLHSDHTLELAAFIGNASLYLEGRKSGKALYNIYGPLGTGALVNAAVRFMSIPLNIFSVEGTGRKTDFAPFFAAHEIAHPGLVYQDDKIRVTAIENTHYKLMPAKFRKQYKSYSYRIETPHGVIVFTGDTGPCPPLKTFARGADVLVSEIMNGKAGVQLIERRAAADHWPAEERKYSIAHMTEEHLLPADVAKLAKAADVRAVLLNHIGPGLDNDEGTVKADVAGVRAGYSGQVIASRDLDRYCVDVHGKKGPALTPCNSPRQ